MNSVQMPVVEEGVAVVLIDVQERLARAMPELGPHRDPMIRFLQAAALLKLDLMVTEQYPQGLGPTIPELTAVLPAGTPLAACTWLLVFGEAQSINAFGAGLIAASSARASRPPATNIRSSVTRRRTQETRRLLVARLGSRLGLYMFIVFPGVVVGVRFGLLPTARPVRTPGRRRLDLERQGRVGSHR